MGPRKRTGEWVDQHFCTACSEMADYTIHVFTKKMERRALCQKCYDDLLKKWVVEYVGANKVMMRKRTK